MRRSSRLLLLALLTLMPLGAARAAVAARPGDLVEIELRASFADDKSLVYGPAEGRLKAANYQAAKRPTLKLPVGAEGPVPGLAQALQGARVGQRLQIRVKNAYGQRDKLKEPRFERVRVDALEQSLGPQDYVARFGSFPVVGARVAASPYYEAVVTAVTAERAVLKSLPEDGKLIEQSFGQTSIKLSGDKVTLSLEPHKGAAFEVGGQQGFIAAVDESGFVVDLNSPLAGRDLALDIRVLELRPREALPKAVTWLAEPALAGKRPVVLFLYAEWCEWCHKMLAETFTDVRLRALSERYGFVKVDSDKVAAIKSRFKQTSFPLTVVLDAQGRELGRIEGYADAARLGAELDALAPQPVRRKQLAPSVKTPPAKLKTITTPAVKLTAAKGTKPHASDICPPKGCR